MFLQFFYFLFKIVEILRTFKLTKFLYDFNIQRKSKSVTLEVDKLIVPSMQVIGLHKCSDRFSQDTQSKFISNTCH